jgi:hypothetical protein
MATDTYLELVSDMIMETGLQGGNAPSSIAGAEGDAKKVAYWIRVADLSIQRERIDWQFLWFFETASLTPGSAVVPSPIDRNNNSTNNLTHTILVNTVAKGTLAVIDNNGQAHFPSFMPWNEFSVLYTYETQQQNDAPSYWTIRPDRVILLSEPIASSGFTCKYQFWRKPLPLRNDNDISLIPDDFSRIIICRAKIMYAAHEDAPEVEVDAAAEYDVLLNQMASIYAPDAEWQRMENSDQVLVVSTR